MATFGLVHGAALGAWCWERTEAHVRALGHNTAALDLPLDDPSLGATQLAEIVHDAFRNCGDLVLVGHSISGLVVPIAAQQLGAKRLVFLHAVLPQPGASLTDQVKSEPEMFNPEMLAVPPGGWTVEATATRFLFHDCPPEVAHDAFTRLRHTKPGERVLVSEVTPLTHCPDIPRSYILCRDDRTVTPAWARRAARQRLGVEAIEIPGGHCPMLSRPALLAETLHGCTDRPRSPSE